MKIKTRILLSSTLTVLFSLLALLLIGTSVIGTWSLGLFNGERGPRPRPKSWWKTFLPTLPTFPSWEADSKS
ncbi:MAG: hypothetical protein IIY11_03670 [Clostridia bacterium]|nr:hypothetical protein [Clostridia bacterium]